MNNITQSNDTIKELSVFEIVKELYQCAGTGFSGQALFYEKIDELLLSVAQDNHLKDADLGDVTRNYWNDYFPDQEYNSCIENLMSQYRIKRRNWIWAVFKRFRTIKEENIRQLEMVLKVRSAVAQGIYSRDELFKIESDEYYRTEVSVFLGNTDCLSSGEADAITNERILRELNSIYDKWNTSSEEWQSSYKTRNKEYEEDSRSNTGRKISQDKLNMFVNPLIDNVCLQFIMMEITASERYEQDMRPRELIMNNMQELWPVMPRKIREHQNEWIFYVKNTLSSIRQFRPLLFCNYSDIRDVTIKEAARIRICTSHVIAESEDYSLTNDEIIGRVLLVLKEAFHMDADSWILCKSIQRSLNQFYPDNENKTSKKTVWLFMNKHKTLIDKWYQWNIEKDRNLADKESADIARKWAEYNERLYLAEKSVRKEVIADLIRGLSDKNYGNILAQMYLISRGKSKEDPGEVLRNFFILLRNMEFCLEPCIGEKSSCPGWMLNGEIIVDPCEEEKDVFWN